MAVRTRIENGIGMMPVPDIPSTANEAELKSAVSYLAGIVRDVVKKINGRLMVGDGVQSTQSGSLDGQFIEYVFPAPADTEVELWHGLGRAPVVVLPVAKDRACDVYVSNNSGWGAEKIYLKCSVASATVKLWLL